MPPLPPAFRRRHLYDWRRARQCIYDDYWGAPTPRFNDKQFERVFRVTRSIADRLLQVCALRDKFFRENEDIHGNPCIDPKAKLLMGLKVLAYGVSPSAFIDYFQMGLTTGNACVKKLVNIISSEPSLRNEFLRKMTRDDAKRISDMHYEKHGVRGMIGSLDCMHVFWRCCPVAWQGAFQGKSGSPSIVLEAVIDYSLWIWHAAFCFPGSLNDINIWEQSPLLAMFTDGTFARDIDFEFEIDDTTFNKLWVLVDGIYPELARFVKTISVPLSKAHKRFAKWQESTRKSVERGFGVLQRKFMILVRKQEFWFLNDINDVVFTCIILHNMMVQHRLDNDDEMESEENYEINWSETDLADEEAGRLIAEYRYATMTCGGQHLGTETAGQGLMRNQKTLAVQMRWADLQDQEAHFRLREKIVKDVNKRTKK